MTSPPATCDVDSDIARSEVAVAEIRRAARECAIADATLMSATIALANTVEEERFQPDQVALVLGCSRNHALAELTWGRDLIAYLPDVWAAWRAGAIDRYRAWIFCNTLVTLFAERPDLAAGIAAQVLPGAGDMRAAALRQRLRRLLLRADSDAIAKRVRLTAQERHVYLTPGAETGLAALGATHLPAARAAAAFERIDALARARRRDGDVRTLAQLRADTFCDLLEGVGIGASPAARPGVVELTIPLATAAGVGAEPGDIAGYGPVVADVARQIAAARHDYHWRYSVTHHGQLIYHGTTRARPELPSAGKMSVGGGPCDRSPQGSDDGDSTATARDGVPSRVQSGNDHELPSGLELRAPRGLEGRAVSFTGSATSEARPPAKTSITRADAGHDEQRSAARPPDLPHPSEHHPSEPETSNHTARDRRSAGARTTRATTDARARDARPASTARAGAPDARVRVGAGRSGDRSNREPSGPTGPNTSSGPSGPKTSSGPSGPSTSGGPSGPSASGDMTIHRPCPPIEADPRRRLPGPALRRWVASRDRVCQAPGCQTPARACDVDHVRDHARGGSTDHANLMLLCRRHHRAKHLGFLTPIMVRPGQVLWVTRTGQVYWNDQ